MTKIIKKVTLNAPASTSTPSTSSGQTGVDPTKGTETNPYTQEEFYSLLDLGIWPGGWVEGMGYAIPQTTITSNYLIDSEWFLWNSWDFWTSWYLSDSWHSMGIIVPFSVNLGGGNGNGQNGMQNNTSAINIANSVVATTSFIKAIQQSIMNVPHQLWYLLNKIKFDLNPNTASKDYAHYDPKNKTIYIIPEHLNSLRLTHEMIHALQHDLGFMNSNNMHSCHYNLEYEAYVLCDILNYKHGCAVNGMTVGFWKSGYYSYIIMESFKYDENNPIYYSFFANHITDEAELVFPFIFSKTIDLVIKDYDESEYYPNGNYDYSLVSEYLTSMYSSAFSWHWSNYFQILGIETR